MAESALVSVTVDTNAGETPLYAALERRASAPGTWRGGGSTLAMW